MNVRDGVQVCDNCSGCKRKWLMDKAIIKISKVYVLDVKLFFLKKKGDSLVI